MKSSGFRRVFPFCNAAVMAMLAAACALTLSWALGRGLQQREWRRSHQQPGEDTWAEPSIQITATQMAAGRKLFLNNCAHCHGADATGDEGPDLHEVATSDRYIKNIIVKGIPHEMPSFRKKLQPEDLQALLVYVRGIALNNNS